MGTRVTPCAQPCVFQAVKDTARAPANSGFSAAAFTGLTLPLHKKIFQEIPHRGHRFYTCKQDSTGIGSVLGVSKNWELLEIGIRWEKLDQCVTWSRAKTKHEGSLHFNALNHLTERLNCSIVITIQNVVFPEKESKVKKSSCAETAMLQTSEKMM